MDDLARLRRQALTIVVDECPDRHPAPPVVNRAAEVFPNLVDQLRLLHGPRGVGLEHRLG